MLSRTSTSPSGGTKCGSPVTDSGQKRSNSRVRVSALVSEPITTVQLRPPRISGLCSIRSFRYDAVSWKEVNIATFCAVAVDSTASSASSFGSGTLSRAFRLVAKSPKVSRSFSRAGRKSSLNLSAGMPPSEAARALSISSALRKESSSIDSPTSSRTTSGGGTTSSSDTNRTRISLAVRIRLTVCRAAYQDDSNRFRSSDCISPASASSEADSSSMSFL